MIKAVIDIGTNSTRLFVANVNENKIEGLLKMLATTRLGEGILSSDSMLEKPMARTSDAVRDFVNIAKEKGAEEIYNKLSEKFVCEYDEAGSIGKRYRRQDEIGTPYCITVDEQTTADGTVTIRYRDTMKQERMTVEEVRQKILKEIRF